MSFIESNLATALAESFSGESDITELAVESSRGLGAAPEAESADDSHYDFGEDIQLKIATLAVKDNTFARKTHGLIKPEYFENAAVGALVGATQEYWDIYGVLPSSIVLSQIVTDSMRSGKIRRDLIDDVKDAYRAIKKGDLADRDYIADSVASFARHKAIELAMIKAIDLMGKNKYDQVADLIKTASNIGISNIDSSYDYFAEIKNRSAKRKDIAAGLLPDQGITTGLKKIDDHLYHRGWGKKELSILMGGPKSGKSLGLLFFAKNAALAGHNTLYITLEMSVDIAAARVDACISETEMQHLGENIHSVEELVEKAGMGAARLFMMQMPGYSLTPSGLRRIIEAYGSEGTRFDLIVLDYMDLMSPDVAMKDPRENSKNIYVNVRAIGQEDDIAILSATQTNREGAKSVVAKAEHAADDFNKIRIADLTISINADDNEKDRNEARLHFAASRNEVSGVTIQIKNDIQRMIFIKSVVGLI